ncbi:uncharacterized protein [Procambarus clarkii]|uniref:uncharacterized protein n=1 Tax=Procambarus clarkii TaxID=6728 RepID=UPI003744333F
MESADIFAREQGPGEPHIKRLPLQPYPPSAPITHRGRHVIRNPGNKHLQIGNSDGVTPEASNCHPTPYIGNPPIMKVLRPFRQQSLFNHGLHCPRSQLHTMGPDRGPQGHQRPWAHHQTTARNQGGAHPFVKSLPGHSQHQSPHYPWQRKPPHPTAESPPTGKEQKAHPRHGHQQAHEPPPLPTVETMTHPDPRLQHPKTQPLKSLTLAQAVDERLERLGTDWISSEPEADPETRAPPAGRTDARRRTAAASTTGETGPHTAGGFAATPAPSTGGTRGEDAGPSPAAEDE